MWLTITSKGKGGKENALQAPNDDIPKKQFKKEESKQGDTPSSVKQANEKITASTWSALIVLRYILKSQRKDGKAPFSECTIVKDTTNANVKHNKVKWATFRENGVLLVHKAHYSKLTKAPLCGFVASFKGLLCNSSTLNHI